ncbi:hypothetical protein BJ742DRAFT_804963 [Cladochytrium replicatum]|nr:hypothetical protein BJ742DRAFT_804963 [Cladochytrium replicatum]
MAPPALPSLSKLHRDDSSASNRCSSPTRDTDTQQRTNVRQLDHPLPLVATAHYDPPKNDPAGLKTVPGMRIWAMAVCQGSYYATNCPALPFSSNARSGWVPAGHVVRLDVLPVVSPPPRHRLTVDPPPVIQQQKPTEPKRRPPPQVNPFAVSDGVDSAISGMSAYDKPSEKSIAAAEQAVLMTMRRRASEAHQSTFPSTNTSTSRLRARSIPSLRSGTYCA